MGDGALTRRPGRQPRGGPHEGVPQHLQTPLIHWVAAQFGDAPSDVDRAKLILRIAAAADVALEQPRFRDVDLAHALIAQCQADEEQFLDVIHAALALCGKDLEGLEQFLRDGQSVWTATKEGLQRHVGYAAQNGI
jgi:hypothetical protein